MSEQTSSILENLNPPQLEAVKHFNGPILVLAGAGSGKTRVLTRRIAYLINEHKINPSRILAVTFTNKAAKEMQERVHALLGENSRSAWISTFHSAGVRFLRRHANLLDYSNHFAIYDDQDSKNLLKGILKEFKIDERNYPLYNFMHSIDRAKNCNVTPAEFINSEVYSSQHLELHAKVYERYQRALKEANAMDFGDLIMNMVQILQNNREVLEYYQNELKFVLVDEFQDTNMIQYLFIRLISEKYKNLLVVGDDDQSIYAFRGATINNILEFERDFPQTKTIKLEQNYRSTGNILMAAQSVIEKNLSRKEKSLWTEGPMGSALTAFCDWDEESEANYVAAEILKNLDIGVSAGDIAIFYRTNAQSRALEEALLNFGIKYRIYGGLRFYDRREIKDILAYLRILLNPFDLQAFLRIINTPTRGIGAQTIRSIVTLMNERGCSAIEAAQSIAERNKHVAGFIRIYNELKTAAPLTALSEFLRQVIELTQYGPSLRASKDPTALSRLENLAELQALGRSMENFSDSNIDILRHFLDRACLSSSAEPPEEETEKDGKPPEFISLMTLHLAKGLEFPIVFLTGMEEGLIPHHRSIIEGDIEEERRLCYVGMTRAMRQLYLTRCRKRGLFNAGENLGGFSPRRRVSRFAFDIPEECVSGDTSGFFGDSSFLETDDESGDWSRESGDYTEDEIAPEYQTTFSGYRKFRKKGEKNRPPKIFSADELKALAKKSRA